VASLLPVGWDPWKSRDNISLTVQELRYRVDRQTKISGQAHKRTLLKTMPPSLRGWWLLLKQPECIFTKQNNKTKKLSTAQTPLATPYPLGASATQRLLTNCSALRFSTSNSNCQLLNKEVDKFAIYLLLTPICSKAFQFHGTSPLTRDPAACLWTAPPTHSFIGSRLSRSRARHVPVATQCSLFIEYGFTLRSRLAARGRS